MKQNLLSRCLAISLSAISLSALACTNESTEPTNLYHGTWNGSIVDRVAGAGTMQLVIPGVGLNGTFAISLNAGATTLSGSTAPYQILSGRLNITFPCPPGSGVFVVALDGDRLKGTYTATNCPVLTDGTVDLGK